MIGTEIWATICSLADRRGSKFVALQKKWRSTPWIVNAPSEGREDNLRDWCREQYGSSGDRWEYGCYVCGYTWFGFHRREQLETFCSAWDIEMPGDAA